MRSGKFLYIMGAIYIASSLYIIGSFINTISIYNLPEIESISLFVFEMSFYIYRIVIGCMAIGYRKDVSKANMLLVLGAIDAFLLILGGLLFAILIVIPFILPIMYIIGAYRLKGKQQEKKAPTRL